MLSDLRRGLLWLLAFVALLSVTVATAAQPDTAPLALVVLGSGGPGATGRAGASYLVLIDGEPRILVDAGPGAVVRVGEAGLGLEHLDTILLTHLHADHAGGLPGMIKACAVSGADEVRVKIFGPSGARAHGQDTYFPSTTRFVDLLFGPRGAFAYLTAFAAPVHLDVHDVRAGRGPGSQPTTLLDADGVRIRAIRGRHADAPSVIYRIDHGGKSITFSGDIDPGGLAALRKLAQGSDLLVVNSVVLDPPGSPDVLYTLHTPPKAIGTTAQQAQVPHLLLSHVSPAVETHASEVLNSVRQGYAGRVEFASDGLRVEP